MAKVVKKVDLKAVAKNQVMEAISTSLTDLGFQIVDGEAFGMTKGTIIVRLSDVDIQIKPIAPKTGLTRYEVATEE